MLVRCFMLSVFFVLSVPSFAQFKPALRAVRAVAKHQELRYVPIGQAEAMLRYRLPTQVLRQQLYGCTLQKTNILPGGTRLQGAIFDLDGTLVDSLAFWKNSSSDFLRSQGIVPPAGINEEMAKLSLLDGATLLKERFHLKQTPEQIVQAVVGNLRQKYATEIPLKPGVKAFLLALKQRGVRMGVATASDKELAELVLRRHGVRDLFEVVVTCDEVGRGKHHPAVYEAVHWILKTPRASTWVFEDALYAAQTASRAGFAVAVVEDAASFPLRQQLRRTGQSYITSFERCTIAD